MPLTARCHSLRPEKTTGWLAYFELPTKSSSAAHFLVVGPASVDRVEDVNAALRAGQAAVRYLKEVPSHAPPVTLLEATARILAHESGRTGTPIEFGCAVLHGDQLWLLTRGSVRLVPLSPEPGIPVGTAKPHAVSVAADERFFLGRLPKGSTEERISHDFRVRLEHGGGGDGGLVLQIVAGEFLQAVEETPARMAPKAVAPFDTVLKELQHTLKHVPPPEMDAVPDARPEPESRPEHEAAARHLEATGDAAGPAERAAAIPAGKTGKPDADTEPTVTAPTARSIAFEEGVGDQTTHAPAFASDETRGLGFWLAVVAAVLALGVLLVYVYAIRPHAPGGNEVAQTALQAEETAPLPPDNFAEARVWEDRFTEAVTSSPLIVDDKVIFGCRDGRVYALSRESGRRMWAYAAPDGFGSSPSLCGDLVVIGGYDGNVYALDAMTGEERWSVKTRGRIVSSPAVNAGTVYAGSYDHNVYAINAVDGRVLWMRDLGSVLWSSPLYAEGLLVAAGLDGHVFALDADTGKIRWQADTGSPIYSSPASGGGKLYVGSKSGQLYAFDAVTGATAWKLDAGSEVNGSPGYYDGMVVVGTDAGVIVGVTAETGEQAWQITTGGEIKSRPAFVGRMAWIPGYDGVLHGIDWRSGEEVRQIRTDSSAFSSPAIRDGVAYYGAMDGRFFAIRVVGMS